MPDGAARGKGASGDAPMRVMLDTNVALDLLLSREPFVGDALHLFALAEAGLVELVLSSDAISTIFYIVSKNAGQPAGRAAIARMLDFVTLAPLDEDAVLRGLALDFRDIEDALVAAVAADAGTKAIVTRNCADFGGSPVPAISPHEFLAAFEAKRRSSEG